jgi:hypothetical protein
MSHVGKGIMASLAVTIAVFALRHVRAAMNPVTPTTPFSLAQLLGGSIRHGQKSRAEHLAAAGIELAIAIAIGARLLWS